MIYKDLTQSEKRVFIIIDNYLSEMSKQERKRILKVFNLKYKGDKKQ
jgi:hypothetical protein